MQVTIAHDDPFAVRAGQANHMRALLQGIQQTADLGFFAAHHIRHACRRLVCNPWHKPQRAPRQFRYLHRFKCCGQFLYAHRAIQVRHFPPTTATADHAGHDHFRVVPAFDQLDQHATEVAIAQQDACLLYTSRCV